MEPEPTVSELRAKARFGRKAFASSPLGTFERTMRQAMRDYHRMRDEGVSRDDAIRGLEGVVRDCWPAHPSKFRTCDWCDGSGRRLVECNHGMRCGRKRCAFAAEEYAHSYVVPCDCTDGDRYRRRSVPPTAVDALTQIGRAKKPKGFSRVGQ